MNLTTLLTILEFLPMQLFQIRSKSLAEKNLVVAFSVVVALLQ